MTEISLLRTALLSVLLTGPLLLVADETEFVIAECPTNYPKDKIATIAHEYDCTKYYACLGNKKQLSECPLIGDTRHFFNPKLGVCDWPANVDCEQPRLAVSPLRAILPVPIQCPRQDSVNYTVHIAHESDCTKFYKCVYGKKILLDCACTNDGSRLYFNKTEQVCDWSFNVDCESRDPSTETPCPATDGSSSTDPGTFGCKGKCPNDDPPNHITALPHEDCRKWCRCQNHEVKIFICPGDLHFCPNLKICTTREIAGCK